MVQLRAFDHVGVTVADLDAATAFFVELRDPELLILDEPANGLDPEGVWWLRDANESTNRSG